MTNSIVDFAKSFFWNNQASILTATLAVPVAIEAASLAGKIACNPQHVKNKFISAKKCLIRSVTRQEGETQHQFRIRLVKNVLKVLGCLLLIGAAAACPFILLPSVVALPAALISIYCVGFLLKNGPKVTSKLSQLKVRVIDAFTPRANETEGQAHSRIFKNAVKATLIAAAVIGLGVAAYYIALLAIAIVAVIKATGSYWAATSILPHQTPLVVFLEYAIVGVIHFALAFKCLLQKDRSNALLHLISGVLSFMFPISYLLGPGIMRLHHSFTGLLLLLAPFRGVKFLGSVITFDSALYWIAPIRETSEYGSKDFDFMNILLPNLTSFVDVLVATSIFQLISNSFFSKEEAVQPNETPALVP